MIRFLLSLFVGLIVGVGLGFYLGWVQFPVEYTESPAKSLSQRYKDDYTLMIAGSLLVDSDATSAIQRLRVLGEDNVPEYVRRLIERYISNSRDVGDIRQLVALYEGLTGQVTPIMEPYRKISVTGSEG